MRLELFVHATPTHTRTHMIRFQGGLSLSRSVLAANTWRFRHGCVGGGGSFGFPSQQRVYTTGTEGHNGANGDLGHGQHFGSQTPLLYQQPTRKLFVRIGPSSEKHHEIEDERFAVPEPPAHHPILHYASTGRTALSTAFIGVGSNIGDRSWNLVKVMNRLREFPGTRITHTSLLYETRASYDPMQPNFLNTVIKVRTFQHPVRFLKMLKELELEMGRDPKLDPKDPRMVDIDLLMFNAMQIDTPELTLPHSLLRERGFALRPLCDIDPNLRHPVAGRPMQYILDRLIESEKLTAEEEPVLRQGATPEEEDDFRVRHTFSIRALHDRRCFSLDREGHKLLYPGDRTFIFGVVTVTGGSKTLINPKGVALPREKAVKRALEQIDAGADLVEINHIDVGDVTGKQELDTIIPIVQDILKVRPEAYIGVATFRASVAKAAVEAGARLVNDVSGGELDSEMLGTVGELGVPYILTHVRGSPQMIMRHPDLLDYGVRVTKRVFAELEDRVERAQAAGIARWNLMVDPGLGMGKKAADCHDIVCHMRDSCPSNIPIVCSVSRKAFVTHALKARQHGKAADWEHWDEPTIEEKDLGSMAAIVAGISSGADIVRVHDVESARHVCRVADQLFRTPEPQ